MPIPWEKVILHGPQILDAARGLYGKWQTRSKEQTVDPNAEAHVQLRELALRLKAIEEGEEAQSGIIEQLAEQSQALSTGVGELKQQVTDYDLKFQELSRLETSITEQLKHYSARLEKQERASEANSRKLSLALYTGFAAFALAGAAFIIVITV